MVNKNVDNLKSDYIITLGYNCFTRRFLTYKSIIKTKEQGRLSFPFDLCVSECKGVTNLLKTDFQDFFDDIEFDDNQNIYINHKHKIFFWHDEDCKNLDEFKIRYKNRIKNYKELVYKKDKDSKLVFIMLIKENTKKREIINLYKTLNKKFNNFALILLNPYPKLKFQKKHVWFLSFDFPFKDFDQNWDKKEYFHCDKFEALMDSLASQIIEILSEKKEVSIFEKFVRLLCKQ